MIEVRDACGSSFAVSDCVTSHLVEVAPHPENSVTTTRTANRAPRTLHFDLRSSPT